jgi:hypothetical protein
MTAYRQDALRCGAGLWPAPLKASILAKATGVTRAATILRDDHYGWFQRVERGIYALTDKGRAELSTAESDLAALGLTLG